MRAHARWKWNLPSACAKQVTVYGRLSETLSGEGIRAQSGMGWKSARHVVEPEALPQEWRRPVAISRLRPPLFRSLLDMAAELVPHRGEQAVGEGGFAARRE